MTNGEQRGTGGGDAGASGIAPRVLRRILLAALVAFGMLQASANALSRIADLRDSGVPFESWIIAVDEGSSLASWIVCMAAIWWLVARLRPPRFNWPGAVALHALATVPISLFHVGLMVAFRVAAHALADSVYRFTGDLPATLLYEYRKDALTYVLLALSMAAIQWLTRERTPSGRSLAPETLEVVDGAFRHRVPIAEIDWAEAAGNYVTLHWRGRALLHRTTLAALAETLAPHGFARIHRSRLVRRSAIRRIATGQSGDFSVTLADGTEIRGSRRHRAGLAVG